jgi:hypothetical protein
MFFFAGGLVVCSGGVYLDARGGRRRKRNIGGEGQWSGHILNIIDVITNGMILFVTLLVILSVY